MSGSEGLDSGIGHGTGRKLRNGFPPGDKGENPSINSENISEDISEDTSPRIYIFPSQYHLRATILRILIPNTISEL